MAWSNPPKSVEDYNAYVIFNYKTISTGTVLSSYFSQKPYLNYDSRIKNIPNITYKRNSDYYGIISYYGGSVIFENTDGFFDSFLDNYYLIGGEVQIVLIKNDIESQDLFYGFIKSIEVSGNEFKIDITDKTNILQKKLSNDYSGKAEGLKKLEDILLGEYGITYNSTNYDTTAWEKARKERKYVMVNYADPAVDFATEPVADIIEKISASLFGSFFFNSSGKFSFKIIDDTQDALFTIPYQDIIKDYDISYELDKVYSSISIEYFDEYATSRSVYKNSSYEASVYSSYNKYEEFSIDSLLYKGVTADPGILSIAYSSSLNIYCGVYYGSDFSKVGISSNGTIWEVVNTGLTYNREPYKIAWLKDKFVMVGNFQPVGVGTPTYFAYSYDGYNWSEVDIPNTSYCIWKTLCYHTSLNIMVALGYTPGSTSCMTVMVSSTASVWTPYFNSKYNGSQWMDLIPIYDDPTIKFFGCGIALSSSNAFIYSTNGTVWNPVCPAIGTTYFYSAFKKDSRYIAYGSIRAYSGTSFTGLLGIVYGTLPRPVKGFFNGTNYIFHPVSSSTNEIYYNSTVYSTYFGGITVPSPIIGTFSNGISGFSNKSIIVSANWGSFIYSDDDGITWENIQPYEILSDQFMNYSKDLHGTTEIILPMKYYDSEVMDVINVEFEALNSPKLRTKKCDILEMTYDLVNFNIKTKLRIIN